MENALSPFGLGVLGAAVFVFCHQRGLLGFLSRAVVNPYEGIIVGVLLAIATVVREWGLGRQVFLV
jgi:hypothetical protein